MDSVPELEGSLQLAVNHYLTMEKRLTKIPKLCEMPQNFMREFL